MDVNERIARALGWEIGVHGHWKSPDGRYDLAFPDYAHSLDACLPVLADLVKQGWTWQCGVDGLGNPWATLRKEHRYIPSNADTPPATAGCSGSGGTTIATGG